MKETGSWQAGGRIDNDAGERKKKHRRYDLVADVLQASHIHYTQHLFQHRRYHGVFDMERGGGGGIIFYRFIWESEIVFRL